MSKRDNVLAVLNHEKPDSIPLDFGGTGQTGISASVVYRLRKLLGLPERPIRIIEPMQMLGEIDGELLEWMDGDVVGLYGPTTLFGAPLLGETTPWEMSDG